MLRHFSFFIYGLVSFTVWSDGKCQQRSNLQNWIAVINTPRTDTHRIYAMHTLIMTFTFADLTAVDICHPTVIPPSLHLWVNNRDVTKIDRDIQMWHHNAQAESLIMTTRAVLPWCKFKHYLMEQKYTHVATTKVWKNKSVTKYKMRRWRRYSCNWYRKHTNTFMHHDNVIGYHMLTRWYFSALYQSMWN